MSVYDFTVKGADGRDVSLSEYSGRVVLIVNTATDCVFTPQYAGLQELYEKYEDKGLTILDFPCNSFGGQAPGDIEEINKFRTLKYNVTFPLMAKTVVNGDGADPLFTYLKSCKGGIFGSDIKWNFTKFLIDRTGTPVRRYAPVTSPEKIEDGIIALI